MWNVYRAGDEILLQKTQTMFTSRFVKFKAVIEDEGGGGVITNLRINPMCIEAYVEDNVSYSVNGMEVNEDAVRIYTRTNNHPLFSGPLPLIQSSFAVHESVVLREGHGRVYLPSNSLTKPNLGRRCPNRHPAFRRGFGMV